MKFEEALAKLRNGEKIRHPHWEKDEYLMACKISLIGDDTSFNEKPMSIVKMKDDRQDNSMAGLYNYVGKIKRQLKKILDEEDYKKYHNIYTEVEISKIFDNDIFKYPQLNLYLIMSNEWEVYNEK